MLIYRKAKGDQDIALLEYELAANVASERHTAYTDNGVGYLVPANIPATLTGRRILIAQEDKDATVAVGQKALFFDANDYEFEADTNADTAVTQRFHRYNLSDERTIDIASGEDTDGAAMVKEIIGAASDRKVRVVINSYETN